MKVNHLTNTLLLAGTLFLAGCKTAVEPSVNSLAPERVRALAAEAYTVGYPLVMNYATLYRHALDPASDAFTGGFGQWLHSGFATPGDRAIVSPNNDTPYSWAWMDLRAEPYILIMPPIDPGRYYTAQVDDLWGFVLDSPGSVIDGQQGGTYLIAAGDWEGTVPAGVKRVIRGESRIAGMIARTGADGPDDLASVRAIQSQYRIMPLHEYTGSPAPAAPAEVDWIPFVTGDEHTIEAFKYMNFALQFVIPNELDRPALDSMALLGIVPGMPWDTTKFTDATKEALRAGIADARRTVDTYRPRARSGDLFNTRAVMGTKYLERMLGVQIGIFGNYASQAVYLGMNKDSDGNTVNTALANYKITFRKDKLPPASYFWSITIYSMPEHLLVPNGMNRYSIGSRSPQLETNTDGSIDIYLCKDSPGKALENNWLPAPDGEPFVIMRIYGPAETVLDGTYQLPKPVKIN